MGNFSKLLGRNERTYVLALYFLLAFYYSRFLLFFFSCIQILWSVYHMRSSYTHWEDIVANYTAFYYNYNYYSIFHFVLIKNEIGFLFYKTFHKTEDKIQKSSCHLANRYITFQEYRKTELWWKSKKEIFEKVLNTKD